MYNGEGFLAEALASHQAQTFEDFELLISDNASTDGTEEIARGFADRDPRFRYHRHPRNIGLAANHNFVFEQVRGKYFKWAAADDVCLPAYLERCVAELDAEPETVLVYPHTRFMDADGVSLDIHDPGWDLRSGSPCERLRFVLRSGHWVNSITGLIRASALSETRLMPTYPGGDYRILAELSLLGTFHEISEPLFLRRLHRGASSNHASDGHDPDTDWLVAYWAGGDRSAAMPAWNLCLDQTLLVVRSGLPVRQKLSLLRTIMGVVRDRRSCFWRELKVACGRRPAPRGTTIDVLTRANEPTTLESII